MDCTIGYLLVLPVFECITMHEMNNMKAHVVFQYWMMGEYLDMGQCSSRTDKNAP
jgi:hypothetical protein